MHAQQWILLGIIVIGGAAVIGSYIHGIATHAHSASVLWGGTPRVLRLVNIPFMILAAIGFIAFTYYILFRLNPEEVQIADRFDFSIFYVLFALILIPSALWMPLTFSMIAHPSTGLWVGIRLILAVVGITSIALLLALLNLNTNATGLAYWFAISGATAFCIQTFVFDTFLWSAFFLT